MTQRLKIKLNLGLVLCGLLAIANTNAQLLQGFEPNPEFEQTRPINGDPNTTPVFNQTTTSFQEGSLLFSDLTTPAVDLDREELPARATHATVQTLNAKERAIARAAWSYVENNTNQASGFVRAVEKGETLSVWDLGNAIAAIESARRLNLISKVDYDQRLRQLISSLAKLDTYEGLPNHVIDFNTGRHPDPSELISTDPINHQVDFTKPLIPKGVQSKDIAYLLVWLEAVKRGAPYLANPIDALVSNWNFCDLQNTSGQFLNKYQSSNVSFNQPVQGLGYDAFTRKAFSLWGFETAGANINVMNSYRFKGVELPIPVYTNQPTTELATIYSDTFFLDGLLFGWDQTGDVASELMEFSDGWRAEIAHRLYQLQYERYKETGVLTAKSSVYDPQSKLSVSDKIGYTLQPIFSRGVPFNTTDTNAIPKPKLASLSTKAAYNLWALWDTPYTRLLKEAVGDSYSRSRGFPEGIYENYGGKIDAYSLDTNTMILMALAYRHKGPLVPKANSNMPSAWNTKRQKPSLQQTLCLPKPAQTKLTSFDPFQLFDKQHNSSTTSLSSLVYQHCDPANNNAFDSSEDIKTVRNCRFFEN
ncbi:MAG: DUF3131 domain-containing protein [Alphaproteobacteria bacterium]